MIFNYLIDENLPSTIPLWNKKNFTHASELVNIRYDTDIWQYALNNDLVIITKDTNFYHRAISVSKAPKVIWIKAGKMKKKEFNKRIKAAWYKIEMELLLKSLIKVQLKK